jgi:hypothetical protein
LMRFLEEYKRWICTARPSWSQIEIKN